MKEIFKKGLLAGIGLAALTKEKVEVLAKDLSKELDLSEEEGKKLVANLSQKAEEEGKHIRDIIKSEIEKVKGKFDYVPASRVKEMQEQMDALQKEIADLKNPN